VKESSAQRSYSPVFLYGIFKRNTFDFLALQL